MHAALLALASAIVGVDWGYRPLASGGVEYIVQIEPQALDDLAAGGGEIVNHVPPELFDVRKFRLTVGKQKLPRGGRTAKLPAEQTAAGGVQVTPAGLTGGGNEHVVELDRESIDQMKRASDLVYEVENVRRYRIRLRQAAAPPTRVERVSAAVAEPTPTRDEPSRTAASPALPAPPPPTAVQPTRAAANPPPGESTSSRESTSPRPSPVQVDTELPAAPPFVPASVVRDPNPSPKSLPPEPQPGAPEPLKIDVAPSADRSPRPLKSGDEPVASPPLADEPTKPTDFKPVDAFPPPALPQSSIREANPGEPSEGAGAPQNPRAAFPGEVPLREPPPRSEEPLPRTETQPAVTKPAVVPLADRPFGNPSNTGPPALEVRGTPEPRNSAPLGNAANDPFAPAPDNPLPQPQGDTPPAGLGSPPPIDLGMGRESPTDTGAVAAPTEPPPARPRGDAPALGATSPALGGFPPLSTPGSPAAAMPSSDTAPPGTNAAPANLSQNNDPFGPPGGAGFPGETAAKATDSPQSPFGPATGYGTRSVPTTLTGPVEEALRESGSHFGETRPPAATGRESSGGLPAAASDRSMQTPGAVPTSQNFSRSGRDESPGPAAATPAPADKKPWWALTGALVVLFGSLGGNVYLGWMNWDLRRQYAALLDTFKQQRANKNRSNAA